MRTFAIVMLAALALLTALPARAGRLFDLSVVDRDTGETLETWPDRGKLYVAGAPGHRYAVRLDNRTAGRLLVVLSVDGVNAVSGETASSGQSGYVLEPWQTTEVSGWRKNLDEVAQFYFTALSDSYAARTDRPDNVGVIGAAVFTERQRVRPLPKPLPKIAEREAARAADAPAAAMRRGASANGMAARESERLGTGHGEREYARVSETRFERASDHPAETLALRYDSYRNLAALGIVPGRRLAPDPNPFPGGFAPDPWR